MKCFRWFLFAALSVTAPVTRGDEAKVHLFQQPHMGCLFSIKIVSADAEEARKAAAAAFARIAALDAALSDYKPDSELSRLGATGGSGKAVAVSEDLWNVLTASQRFWKWSDGVFDVSLGPCTQLWRESRKSGHLPMPETLQTALAASGFQHVTLIADRHAAELHRSGMRLDVGGIAKGFALDEAAKVLREKHQCASFLLDAGGQIAAIGSPPGKNGWRVAIERLPGESGNATTVLELRNMHLATSGDLHQFVEIEGKRYSHIIDPKTGLGSTAGVQASVVAQDGASADVAATVLCLLPPERALNLLRQFPGAEARILIAEAATGRVRSITSQGWERILTAK